MEEKDGLCALGDLLYIWYIIIQEYTVFTPYVQNNIQLIVLSLREDCPSSWFGVSRLNSVERIELCMNCLSSNH